MNPTLDNSPAVADALAVAASAPGHSACGNCRTVLHGHYCHHCGQSAHNPLKHVGHAIEEVFESFWHLDGRIFRTLRDLLAPGRVAVNYLKGQRVGYVQPLRLFVILTLFTFFVGKLTLHVDDFSTDGNGSSLFAAAQSAAEVEALRAAQVAELERQQSGSPTGAAAFAVAMAAVNTAAAQRIAEIEAPAPTQATADAAMSRAAQAATRASARHPGTFVNYPVNGKPWDPQTNPVAISGMPGFVNHWLNQRLANGQANIERMGGKADLYVQAILTALPGALFFLMPVFALVLRVAYLGRGIGYLEHLVVALYSHAWLMLVLLATFLTIGITHAIGGSVANAVGDCVHAALWLAVPVYLLWMQQRVYGGRWWATLARYVFIGSIYFWLVLFVVMYAVLAGVSS